MAPWRVHCETAQLAADVVDLASRAAVQVDVRVTDAPAAAAIADLSGGEDTAFVAITRPSPAEFVALQPTDAGRAVAALLGPDDDARALLAEVGVPATDDLDALVAAIALLTSGAERPWELSLAGLDDGDRARLDAPPATRPGRRLVRADDGLLALELEASAHPLGAPSAVRRALRALHATTSEARPPAVRVEDVDRQGVLDVLYGPARALSDPSSKAVLGAYDLPLPEEELCASASRAAMEASRIGFPVRLTLASPDLPPSQHPDLWARDVHGAARVREVYRQLVRIAADRDPKARVLGVVVSAESAARAELAVSMVSWPGDLVHATIRFVDPHGEASNDAIETLLPTSAEGLGRALDRLRGRSLILGGDARARRAGVRVLGDVLLRAAAFVNDWPEEVDGVEIPRLALLVGGDAELREASVRVSDAFERALRGSG